MNPNLNRPINIDEYAINIKAFNKCKSGVTGKMSPKIQI